MSFVSWQFVLFFALVLLGLRIARSRTSRQLLLLVASCIFYASGTPVHLLVLAVPAVVDFICALRIAESDNREVRRRWLVLSVASNLGLLAYFKYADFFVGTIASLSGASVATLGIALPIGISFFTFKTLSYTIDVYRGEIPPCRSWRQYALFVSFFPELVAGPIVRASVFLPQLARELEPSWQRAAVGAQVILLGLTKKLLIADRLALFADPVFATPQGYSAGTIAWAVVAYSLQIYCDFSGYSDMAIGVARIIGFDLPENFNMPYLARSVTEFWRRWHITLSQWLRDYLYIPLGGNRRGRARTYVNLMLTMLLGGLWHGARWNFVLWGLIHGVALAVHKLVGERRSVTVKAAESRTTSVPMTILSWAATYLTVCLAWIFFRAPTLSNATYMLRKLAGFELGGAVWHFLPLFELLPLVILAHVAGVMIARNAARPSDALVVRPSAISGPYAVLPRAGFVSAFVLTVWIGVLFLFAPLHTSPFIYFQF
ncbi:MAG: rane bound O-acyl transferase family protein [Gemmatimonadetes bacterium]|nr:rane bound O-acyl transferase family protein [Gemmatimonadota bacterium]